MFPSEKYPEVDKWILGSSIFRFVCFFPFFLVKPPFSFPQWMYQLTFPPTLHKSSLSPYPCQCLFAVILIIAILTCVNNVSLWFWFLIPWLVMLSTSPCTCWPSVWYFCSDILWFFYLLCVYYRFCFVSDVTLTHKTTCVYNSEFQVDTLHLNTF